MTRDGVKASDSGIKDSIYRRPEKGMPSSPGRILKSQPSTNQGGFRSGHAEQRDADRQLVDLPCWNGQVGVPCYCRKRRTAPWEVVAIDVVGFPGRPSRRCQDGVKFVLPYDMVYAFFAGQTPADPQGFRVSGGKVPPGDSSRSFQQILPEPWHGNLAMGGIEGHNIFDTTDLAVRCPCLEVYCQIMPEIRPEHQGFGFTQLAGKSQVYILDRCTEVFENMDRLGHDGIDSEMEASHACGIAQP